MPDGTDRVLGDIDDVLIAGDAISVDAMRWQPLPDVDGEAPSPEPDQPASVGFGDIIDAYSRAQAIEDGVLKEVPADLARQAGFRYPLAMSQAVWEDCVAWTEQDSRRQTPQDETGRLWDVVWMASVAVRRNREGDRVPFTVLRVPRGGRARMPREVRLTLVVGPGDTTDPVLTIHQPHEG